MVSATLQIFETKISHIHLPYEKSIIERTIQYIKEIELKVLMMDYFPCRKMKEDVIRTLFKLV
jgi:hypothetical protein